VGTRGKKKVVAERRKARPAVVGGVIAAAVVGAGVGAYALYDGGASAEARTSATADHKAIKKGPLSAAEVQTTAKRFLADWQQGKVAQAAAATDKSTAATALLTGYSKNAHMKGITVTEGAPRAPRSPSP
jgi:hypothetical protein